MKPHGIIPALTTPFSQDGSVSLAAIKRNIERYNGTMLTGYLVLGSTGENVMLSSAESEAVLAEVKNVAAPEKLLIAGTGAESTAETISRTKRAAELRYHVALVKTPYYYKPAYKPETYIQHYRAVADASPIPVLLYSVPVFTGITLETPEILKLAEHPNVLGIKDSSGSIQRVGELVAAAPARFHVLTGGAAVVYPALAVGAVGAILALACVLPDQCAEIYRLFSIGRHAEARELQLRLVFASKRIVSEGGIAGVKYAMDLRSYQGGLPRLPLLPLNEVRKRAIADVLTSLEPATARA